MKKTPYAIARDIPGVGFQMADRIALNAGGRKDSPDRLAACLIHVLMAGEQDGHVFLYKNDLLKAASKLSGRTDVDFDDLFAHLIASEDIRVEEGDDENDADRVYLYHLFRAEFDTAARIKAVLSLPVEKLEVPEDQILEQVLSRQAVKLSDEQLSVVSQALDERIVVLTGGPGTGKTTLVKALCAIYELKRLKVVLSAPTGRAARRLAQVTGKKAFTLHKLLGFDHESQYFERNSANPLNLDVFVVDESSMVDTVLMYRLVEAMPVSARLVLVGDTFQLPSVGPGNVLDDIIESGCIKVFSLTQIFRQAEESPIIQYAHAIRNGEMPNFEKAAEGELSEFYFIENNEPAKVVDTILSLCAKRIPEAFPHIEDIQVLTPMHRGEAGTINLNQQLQSVLNPSPEGISAHGMIFRADDKVMHLKNNYDKDVFNGDIGVVQEVDKKENRVLVSYDGRIVEYDSLDLDELTLAYSISVHKSQGSEYGAVVVALTTAHYPLLQRNLLYTAMTRGRQLVIIVGSSKAVKIALNNNRTDLRLSGLRRRLAAF